MRTRMKGLEDAFDGANRMNLRHFISLADDADADDPARGGMLSQTTTVINGGEEGEEGGGCAGELHA